MEVEVKCTVEPTDSRKDAQGEFIVRLNKDVQDKLEIQPGEFVVLRSDKSLPWYAPKSGVMLEVLAAVRDMVGTAESHELKAPSCQLDMTLRNAIGVKPGNVVTIRRYRQKRRLLWFRAWVRRSVRPMLVLRLLGFQWLVCRVQMSFPGDTETCISRMDQAHLDNLGIRDEGTMVIESVNGSTRRRVRRLQDWHIAIARDMREQRQITSTSSLQQLGPGVDVDQFLGVAPDESLPQVYVDAEVREELGITVGDTIWVRRSTRSVLSDIVTRYGTAIMLAVLGATFSLPDAGRIAVGVVCIFALAVIAWLDVRKMV